MRELQSIGHGLLVTFYYRHGRPNRQGSPGHGTGICVRAEAPSLTRHRCQDPSYSGSRLLGGIALSFPATGLHLGRLAPSLAPKRQKGSRYSHAELRLPSRTRTYGLLLRRHSRNVADVAGHGLTGRSGAARMAGCSLAWPCNCGRWLPVGLPGKSLAALMFECSGPTAATGTSRATGIT
jgi:hypothetical protein